MIATILAEMKVLASIDPEFEVQRRVSFIQTQMQASGCKALVVGLILVR
jgi:NAD+ synthase